MTEAYGLTPHELELIRSVLSRHAEVTGAILFGSRAKGVSHPASDVDLALEGVDDPLVAQAIARELDDLPLPYRFDVHALAALRHDALRAHIDRVGRFIYAQVEPPGDDACQAR